MKTNDELLKFYGLETGKKYEITRTYRQGFKTPISPLTVGEKFTIVFLVGEPDPQILSCKQGHSFPISELNFYDYEECKKDLLDKKEKEYLKFVIKPFKKRFKCLRKMKTENSADDKIYFYITICIDGIDGNKEWIYFPNFSPEENMYKNLSLNTSYTLKELELDE